MEDFENTPVDAGAIASEIGADLFGAREMPVESEAVEAPAVETPPAAEAPPPAAPLKALPKAWKKEMAPHWEKLDPAIHEYVYSREEDMMKGIQQYQDGYSRWNSLIQPYQNLLAQHPDVNPVQLMQNLMQSHVTLLSAPPEQKVAMVKKLLQDYQVDLPLAGSDETPSDAGYQRELQSLRNEVLTLKSHFTNSQKRIYEEGVAEQRKLVDGFFSDPKNEFAEELGNDILLLLKSGAAKDLAGAYEMALWANPGTRAKMLAKQQAAAEPKPVEKKGSFPNIESNNDPRPVKGKKQSMDDTIMDVIRKYSSET